MTLKHTFQIYAILGVISQFQEYSSSTTPTTDIFDDISIDIDAPEGQRSIGIQAFESGHDMKVEWEEGGGSGGHSVVFIQRPEIGDQQKTSKKASRSVTRWKQAFDMVSSPSRPLEVIQELASWQIDPDTGHDLRGTNEENASLSSSLCRSQSTKSDESVTGCNRQHQKR